MTTREKMIDWRNKSGITIKQLSLNTGVSQTLLGMVEAGHVTHPLIVKKIKRAYRLTDLEAEELLPKCRRKHGSNYDPDMYKPLEQNGISISRKNSELIDIYVKEHQERMVKQHARRSVY